MSCSAPLVDAFNRRISYLRLSVTDRCDLRCSYCMPEKMTFLPRKDVLSLEELHKLSLAMIERGISKIRLTGGEPLVRRDMIELVPAIGRKLGDGLHELTLTTNGTQLEKFAEPLFAAGVRRINVSLDTMDAGLFAELSRRDRRALRLPRGGGEGRPARRAALGRAGRKPRACARRSDADQARAAPLPHRARRRPGPAAPHVAPGGVT